MRKLKKIQYTIKELRARKDISQEELARASELTTRTINSYENDLSKLRNASYKNIEKIAKSLDVEVDDIFLG